MLYGEIRVDRKDLISKPYIATDSESITVANNEQLQRS
jgi:hypothetical protein